MIAWPQVATETPTPEMIEEWLDRKVGPTPTYGMIKGGAYVLSPTGKWYRLGMQHVTEVRIFFTALKASGITIDWNRGDIEDQFLELGHLVRVRVEYGRHYGYDFSVDVRQPLTIAQLRAIYDTYHLLEDEGSGLEFYGDIEYISAKNGYPSRAGGRDLPTFRKMLSLTGYLPAEAEALVAAQAVNDSSLPTIVLAAGAAIGLYLLFRGR